MRHGRMFLILGDVHGEFGRLNIFINKLVRNNEMFSGMAECYREDGDDFQVIILQCGDFAYFWPLDDPEPKIKNQIEWLPNGHVPIYWTGGNHEDWDRLDAFGPGISEIAEGIFYCPFGSTLEVKPDLTILFAGGAESSDKEWRLEAMEKGAPKIWWEQEGISEKDMERLARLPKADWVISHTAPHAFDVATHLRGFWGGSGHFFEPSRGMLERILVNYKPKHWYFGHFHHFMKGRIDGCQWECLANIGSSSQFWDRVWLEWDD